MSFDNSGENPTIPFRDLPDDIVWNQNGERTRRHREPGIYCATCGFCGVTGGDDWAGLEKVTHEHDDWVAVTRGGGRSRWNPPGIYCGVCGWRAALAVGVTDWTKAPAVEHEHSEWITLKAEPDAQLERIEATTTGDQ